MSGSPVPEAVAFRAAWSAAVSRLPDGEIAEAMDAVRSWRDPFADLEDHDPEDLRSGTEALRAAMVGKAPTGNTWDATAGGP